MKELAKKLLEARKFVASEGAKKSGKNTFAKYDYFTPSQVDAIVIKACDKFGMIPMFSLVRNELGLQGEVTLMCIDTGDILVSKMATDVPQIKATNITQQYGGCETYTKRYMMMSLFGISDNKIDFDSNETKQEVLSLIKKSKTIEELQEIKNAYPDGFTKELKEQYNIINKK